MAVLCSLHINAQEIKKEYLNAGPGYTNVVTVTNGNQKTIYVAGQTGVGDTMADQITSAYKKLEQQLALAGAKFHDIVTMRTYIVQYREKDLDTFRDIRSELYGTENMPANTLLGVTSLYKDDVKVEMEAVAVVGVE